MNMLFHMGRYYLLMFKVFAKPQKRSVYFRQILREVENLGLNSLGIVIIISVFMGAVITLQSAYNLENPMIPLYLIGLTTRDSMILEFSSTVVGLILAGRVGSNIASEIGTMRISEQIDALEIMGINSASYLVFPKVIATIFINPVLNIISMGVGIGGGYLAVVLTSAIPPPDYLIGIRYAFVPFYISYSVIKTIIFAYIITTVSAYHGYYVKGGALEVGRASTKAVVYSSILILLFNVLITQFMLA